MTGISDIERNSIAELKKRRAGVTVKRRGMSVADREAIEHAAVLSPKDGRVRSAQLNMRVAVEFKEEVDRLAARLGMTKVEFIEYAVSQVKPAVYAQKER